MPEVTTQPTTTEQSAETPQAELPESWYKEHRQLQYGNGEEWVLTADWRQLNQEQKDYLNKNGVDAFNKWEGATIKSQKIDTASGQAYVNQLIAEGKLPQDSLFTSYNEATGTLSVKEPTAYNIKTREPIYESYATQLANVKKEPVAYNIKTREPKWEQPSYVTKLKTTSGETVSQGSQLGSVFSKDAQLYLLNRVADAPLAKSGEWSTPFLTQADIEKVKGFDKPIDHLTPVQQDKLLRITLQWQGENEAFMKGAIGVVPVVGTVVLWKEMSTPWKVTSIVLDVLTIVSPIKVVGFIKNAKLLSTAKTAGEAAEELKYSTKYLESLTVADPRYAKLASAAQKAAQASKVADAKFVTQLGRLKNVSVNQLKVIERESQIVGLTKALEGISKAQAELKQAWAVADRFTVGSKRYIAELPKVTVAQAKLSKALDTLSSLKRLNPVEISPAEYKGVRFKAAEKLSPVLTTETTISPLGIGTKGKTALATIEKVETKFEIKRGYQISLVPEYSEPKITPKPKTGVPEVKPAATAIPGLSTAKVGARTVVKEGYDPAYREHIYEKPEVREAQGIYVEAIGKPMEGVNIVVAGRTQRTTGLDAQVRETIADVTKEAIKAAHEAATKNLSKSAIESLVQSKVEARVEAIAKPQVKTQLKMQTKLITKLATEVAVRQRIINIPSSDGTTQALTEKERAGSVQWRQGIIYKLWYPPYGQKNILNRRKPFPGIPMVTGPHSAYRTIMLLGGVLPRVIRRGMGIVGITVTTSGLQSKPVISFTPGNSQKVPRLTAPIPEAVKSPRIPPEVKRAIMS